jgi:hypothetical protein
MVTGNQPANKKSDDSAKFGEKSLSSEYCLCKYVMATHLNILHICSICFWDGSGDFIPLKEQNNSFYTRTTTSFNSRAKVRKTGAWFRSDVACLFYTNPTWRAPWNEIGCLFWKTNSIFSAYVDLYRLIPVRIKSLSINAQLTPKSASKLQAKGKQVMLKLEKMLPVSRPHTCTLIMHTHNVHDNAWQRLNCGLCGFCGPQVFY